MHPTPFQHLLHLARRAVRSGRPLDAHVVARQAVAYGHSHARASRLGWRLLDRSARSATRDFQRDWPVTP